jgi:nucleoside phosphorylase
MPSSQTPAVEANQTHHTHHADVLIVTVTQTEGKAVMDAFLAATGQKSSSHVIGERVYRDLGSVGGARVWMAISEMGSGGLGGSQETVRLALAALAPASVIMVGIAFGVDKKKQAMGRVLVAQQLLPYELQRVGDKDTLSRGDKAHASPRLINWLTQANLDWDDAAGKAKFGLILAGAKLIDNLAFRNQVIGLAPEAIGGEMEGEGLYVACHNAKTDWILVKAICDWADGNKGRNKDANQKLAASNAARFVLHALQTIPLAGTGARAVGATGAHTSAGASGAQAQAFEHVPAHANALAHAHAHAQELEVVLAFCDRSQVLLHLDDFLKAPAPSGKGLLCLVDHVDNCSPALMTRIHQELTGEDTSANGKRIRLLSFGSNPDFRTFKVKKIYFSFKNNELSQSWHYIILVLGVRGYVE